MSEAQDKVQQEEKSEAKPPPMCVECHEFFGNAAMDNMCSVCYKNKKKTVQEAQPKEVKTSPEKKDDLNSSKMSIEENKDEEAEKKPKADPSRCFVCKKKQGYLGFSVNANSLFVKIIDCQKIIAATSTSILWKKKDSKKRTPLQNLVSQKLFDFTETNLTLLKVVFLYGLNMMAIYCLLYTSPSPRDRQKSRMPSSA
eukprot:TRINITY_DN1476_c0_g1_i2.p1 TRINITY_DN1476_c0_g1~~TRINITY_DN1476_c0_g1_i2.p1  ORF type:complete len:198 (-),score=26.48 TRINITY_DN1476_c0_g1_i2:28-621(-)